MGIAAAQLQGRDTSDCDYTSYDRKMPVDPVQNASTSSVLAYNSDSPRGWNDPPTFAFSGNKSGASKPKLDLRKRVSHQQALHGGHTPPPQPTTPTNLSTYTGNEVSNGMTGLSLQSDPKMSPASPQSYFTPQPPIANGITAAPTVPLYTPPTTHMVSSNGIRTGVEASPTVATPPVVPLYTHSMTPTVSNSAPGITTSAAPATTAPTHLGQPLFALKSHSFEPVKPHSQLSIRSTAEIEDHLVNDHSDLAGQHPRIFHPTPQAIINGNPGLGNAQEMLPYNPLFNMHSTTQAGTTVEHITPPVTQSSLSRHPLCSYVTPVPPVTNHASQLQVGHLTPPPSSTSNPPQFPVGHVTPPPPVISNSPQLAVGHVTPPLPVQSTPPLIKGHSTPPPPPPPKSSTLNPPGSHSSGSTPRCLSPQQNEVDDNSSGLSDEEGLKATMDALDDVIQKYRSTCKLEKRISDDVTRRLKIMSDMWMAGKLGRTVKSRMIKLAKALDDGSGEEAHHIHVSIIVDHVTEVNQWIVAVKRLISLVRNNPIRPTSS